jgi:hypothetical protein
MVKECEERLQVEADALIGRAVWDRKGNFRGRITNAWIEDGRVKFELRRQGTRSNAIRDRETVCV